MYEPVEKTSEKKTQMQANGVSQMQNGNAPTSRFVDNRPEAIQMRRLRELAKNSPQNAKLRELHNLSAAHSVTQNKSDGKQGFGFVDNRGEAGARRKLKGMVENNGRGKHTTQYNSMADDNNANRQQPIPKAHTGGLRLEPVFRLRNASLPIRDLTIQGKFTGDLDKLRNDEIIVILSRNTKLNPELRSFIDNAHESTINNFIAYLDGIPDLLDSNEILDRSWHMILGLPIFGGGAYIGPHAEENGTKVRRVHDFMEEQVAPWATQARISELINKNMEEMKGDETISSEMTYLDPSKYRKHDSEYTPQIAPGNSRFLAPSRSKGRNEGEKTAIHRGDLEIEMNGEEPCVRVYSALWAEARPNKDGIITHKDVHQDPKDGNIVIHTGRDQGEAREGEDDKNPIMWISGGQPLRQLKWFYKYLVEKNNPGAKPVVRSFLVPLSVWDEISRAAVNEESAKKEGNEKSPFNVDTAYAANQFGVRGPMLEKLRNSAVPKSLISYTGQRSHSLDEFGGEIVGIERLHEKLGAPLTESPLPVWVDQGQGKFVRTAKQQSLANTLMFNYGIWKGNREFIPKDKSNIPIDRLHEMFNQFLDQHDLKLPKGYSLPNF